MPLFRYTATSISTAHRVTETVEMADEQMVMDYLYVRGLTPVAIHEMKKTSFQQLALLFEGVKENVLFMFLRQFTVLIKAGIPMYRGLDIIIQQTEDKRLKAVCQQIRRDIGEGSTLANALKSHPNVFSEFFVSMVAVGENRGELEYAMTQILDFMERTRDIKNKITAAMVYPLVLIFAGIGIMVAMVTFVLPKFIDIFKDYNVVLPLPTRLLMGFSSFLIQFYPMIILGIIALGVGGYFLSKTTPGRYGFDWLRLRMAIIGTINYHVALSRFARTLGVLHRGGVPLIKNLELSKDAMANRVLGAEIDKVIASVKDGKGISAPLGDSRLFPPMLVQMLGIGEESGALDTLAMEIANFYDTETEYKIKKQMALMEPVALVIIALMVAFIAASFLLPMFRMASSFRQQ